MRESPSVAWSAAIVGWTLGGRPPFPRGICRGSAAGPLRGVRRARTLREVASAAAALRWTSSLLHLLVEELYVDEELERFVDVHTLPPERFPQAVAVAIALRHSWRADDLAQVTRRLEAVCSRGQGKTPLTGIRNSSQAYACMIRLLAVYPSPPLTFPFPARGFADRAWAARRSAALRSSGLTFLQRAAPRPIAVRFIVGRGQFSARNVQ